MRRASLLVGLLTAAAAALYIAGPGTSSAKNEGAKKEAGKSATADLRPISQVVLFSSGVGYFQREGTIDGSQRVDLSFPHQDGNDLIKPLTLRDIDGGHINAVTSDSN